MIVSRSPAGPSQARKQLIRPPGARLLPSAYPPACGRCHLLASAQTSICSAWKKKKKKVLDHPELVDFLLHINQLTEDAIFLGQKLIVGANFGNLALFHHHQAVCISQS